MTRRRTLAVPGLVVAVPLLVGLVVLRWVVLGLLLLPLLPLLLAQLALLLLFLGVPPLLCSLLRDRRCVSIKASTNNNCRKSSTHLSDLHPLLPPSPRKRPRAQDLWGRP